ncbi:MAG: 3-deoxy-7-phosphoheptulonate synthase, partial [Betaproteobacteria bacterium]|nr:3-deoxy-7-phosphoheptulonate synthase [Betaproteobacteria bacterium]
MPQKIDDVRIREIKELLPPVHLLREFPLSAEATRVVYETRKQIHRILHGADDRLVVIVGPCSIHDPKAALDYATRLKAVKDQWADELLIVMRV